MVKLITYRLFRQQKALSLVGVLFLASCTTTPSDKPTTVEEGKDKPAIESSGEIPGQETRVDPNPRVGESALSLLVKARKHAEAGEGEQAAATLERAIRIEPDNPWLWHRLAVLRMQQKMWTQAIELANRSIALAKGNKRIIGGNWLVISLSEEGAGNFEAAEKAKENSDAYLGKS